MDRPDFNPLSILQGLAFRGGQLIGSITGLAPRGNTVQEVPTVGSGQTDSPNDNTIILAAIAVGVGVVILTRK